MSITMRKDVCKSARPRKWRKVCCLPETNLFGPINSVHFERQIVMTVEEYETIRLIDLEGLTQEECAERMNVARTTIQRIYRDARIKLAQSLVNGDVLKIDGGDYQLYGEDEQIHRCGKCRRHRGLKKCMENENMNTVQSFENHSHDNRRCRKSEY